MNLRCPCPHCHQPIQIDLQWPGQEPQCPHCDKALFQNATQAFIQNKKLDQCPLCGASHLFRRKDFNQKLGLGMIVLGVVGAYFTYGISLLIVTLIDWFLFRRVGELGSCYQCQAEFRKSSLIQSLDPFDLEISDYYRNLVRKDP